jgi:hypothetical protein
MVLDNKQHIVYIIDMMSNLYRICLIGVSAYKNVKKRKNTIIRLMHDLSGHRNNWIKMYDILEINPLDFKNNF